MRIDSQNGSHCRIGRVAIFAFDNAFPNPTKRVGDLGIIKFCLNAFSVIPSL
jgi:hypothetical protein